MNRSFLFPTHTLGNGTIDFDEFLEMMTKHTEYVDDDDDVIAAFKVFDKNGDGYISSDELRQVMIINNNNFILIYIAHIQ